MVAPNVPSGTIDVNDPGRRRLIEAKRKHAAQQNKDYSHVFTRKSRLDIIRISFVMFGIEFAYAAETAFVSPILLKIGIDHSKMTLVWSLSPVLGFILAPIMGSLSDKCQLAMGRRRPFILILTIGLMLGLILVPFGKDIGSLLGDYGDAVNITQEMSNQTSIDPETSDAIVLDSYKWAVLFTVIGTILLDFDADNCLTPVRTYLLDVTLPEDQARALSTSTFMAGLGALFGYLIGSIDWQSMHLGRFLGGNIKTVFVLTLLLLAISATITMTSVPEIPLPLIKQDIMLRPVRNVQPKPVQTRRNYNSIDELILSANDLNGNAGRTVNGYQDLEASKTKHEDSEDEEDQQQEASFMKYLKSIVFMPPALRILCLTNYFAWCAHSCYCLYFTDFVGESVFHGDPKGAPDSTALRLYNDGVRFGCYGMAVYSLACVLYAAVVEKLIKKCGCKYMYVGAMAFFSFGMLVLSINPIKELVLISSTTVGVFYATQFTLPYMLVAHYHSKGSFKVKRGEEIPSTETRGLGTDVAIVNSMLFIAQFTVSVSVGFLIEILGSTTAIMYSASAFGVLAAISACKIIYMGI